MDLVIWYVFMNTAVTSRPSLAVDRVLLLLLNALCVK